MPQPDQPLPVKDDELRHAWQFAVKRAALQGCTPEQAQDVAQDVVMRLVQLDESPKNIEAFVTTAVRHRVIDLWRAEGARPKETDLEYADHLGMTPGPSAGAMRGLAIEHLTKRLREVLSDKEIGLLVLDAQGLSHAQIAAATGYKNAAVVKATLTRVRKKAQALGDELFDQIRSHPKVY
jgi:DNA-directed RNA polymerase specialized sigma24 family protein